MIINVASDLKDPDDGRGDPKHNGTNPEIWVPPVFIISRVRWRERVVPGCARVGQVPICRTVAMKKVLKDLAKRLRAKAALGDNPVEVVVECRKGTHRSVATAFALYTIWRMIDNQNVDFWHRDLRRCARRLVKGTATQQAQSSEQTAKRGAPQRCATTAGTAWFGGRRQRRSLSIFDLRSYDLTAACASRTATSRRSSSSTARKPTP